MKKTITVIFLLLFVFANAQSYKVIYKVKQTENPDINVAKKSDEKRIKDFTSRLFEVATNFTYILEFNKEESIYTFNQPMKPEYVDDDIFYLATLLGGKDSIYQNRISKMAFHKVKFDNKDILEKYKLITDWTITKERGRILGYDVIKATNGKHIAWFAPAIPVPFGPDGLGGLPGLILKYQFGLRTIYASKIIKMDKDLTINKPKGEIMAHEVLKEIRIKQMTKQNNNYR